jgi:predicted PolB exonuclease-like 3'-5' exonuclease
MIAALDIETIPNPDAIPFLSEVEAPKNLKDPAKIAAAIAERKVSQIAEMALDALTGRVCCYAMVGQDGGEIMRYVEVLGGEVGDESERKMVQSIMRVLGGEECRLVTWNGIGFDLPFIYKRAMILGVDPAHFGAPPLSAWTKRYAAEKHYDLMQLWGGWKSNEYAKLDTVAAMVLHERKAEIDVTTFPELLKTEEGCEKLTAYCLKDTELTWRLFEKMNGFLFQ